MEKDKTKLKSIFIKFSIPILFIVIVIILYNSCHRELLNPKERNIIDFKNTNIDEIIDSLESLKFMLNNYPFQLEVNRNWITISSENQIIRCDWRKVKISNIDSIKKIYFFENLSNDQLKHFLFNFAFLFDRGLNGFTYFFDNDQLLMFYKDYYLYFDSDSFTDDMMRFLIYDKNINQIDFNLYKLLDSTKNLYLVSFWDSEIIEDDSKYYIRPKHKLQNKVKELFNNKENK